MGTLSKVFELDRREDNTELRELSIQCGAALSAGQGKNATEIWKIIEAKIIESVKFDPFYYSLKRNRDPIPQVKDLESFIDTVIRDHFNSNTTRFQIPESVKYLISSEKVFDHLEEDFMKPVVNGEGSVSSLLGDGRVKVIVYNGQLDLICNTLGTERWVQNLDWPGLPHFESAKREALYVSSNPRSRGSGRIPDAFVKKFQNLEFYWLMMAGHM